MLLYIRHFMKSMAEAFSNLNIWMTIILRPFFKDKFAKVAVWDGHKYVRVHFMALYIDGYHHDGMVVHQRSRKNNDEIPGNLVLMTHYQHRLIHLVEDHYDIDSKEKSEPTKIDMGIYKDLPDYMKKAKPKKNWSSM